MGCPVTPAPSPFPSPCHSGLFGSRARKKLLVGVAAHVHVRVLVSSTAPDRTYPIRELGRGTTAAAGGFVPTVSHLPTVSSNPAGIRRKLGTTIRGPAWQLEPWNLAGQASSRQSGQSGCRSWAGLADRYTARLADWLHWAGRLRHAMDHDSQRCERECVCAPLYVCVCVYVCEASSWSCAQPGLAGNGASQSDLWPPVVSVRKKRTRRLWGQKTDRTRTRTRTTKHKGRRRGSPSWPQDPES